MGLMFMAGAAFRFSSPRPGRATPVPSPLDRSPPGETPGPMRWWVGSSPKPMSGGSMSCRMDGPSIPTHGPFARLLPPGTRGEDLGTTPAYGLLPSGGFVSGERRFHTARVRVMEAPDTSHPA